MAKKQVFEVCVNCGKVADENDKTDGSFKCSKCGADISMVMSRELFAAMAKEFGTK
jgi:predicted RNA-binding Zn-ribbon protein involved in translation (DUF1610 family)